MKLFRKYSWVLFFLLFLLIFSWKSFLKGYLIGPFDFLMGFYDPYYEIKWTSPELFNAVLHYKNNLLSDVVSVVLPPKLLAIQMMKQGIFPLWNPNQMNGTPLLASVQPAVLYWANIFYIIFDPKIAYNIYILLQPLLAFIFMFLYLRNLKRSSFASYFGSLSFSFSAFFIVWLSWGTLGHAFLWLPLVLYSADKFIEKERRRYVFLFVWGLVSSFLAGHTQTSIMVFGTAFLYVIFHLLTNEKKNALKLIFFFTIAILISSIQLLPSWEMYNQSARELLSIGDFYKGQTLLFSSFFQAIFPDFFGHPVTRNYWGKVNYAESAIYFGASALFFTIFSIVSLRKKFDKRFFFLLLVLVGGFLLSTQNPVSHLIYILKIPLLSSSTFSRYCALFIFGASALSAFGFDYVLSDLEHRKYKNIFVTMAFFIGILLTVWFSTIAKVWPQTYINNLQIIKRNSILPTFILGSLFSILSVYILIEKLNSQKSLQKKYTILVPYLLLILLSVELFRFSYKYTPFTPGEFFYPDHILIHKLQEFTKDGRYMQYLPPNVNSIYSIRGIEGKEPLQNLRIAELASFAKGNKIDIFDRTGLQFPNGRNKERITDLFSTKYFVDKNDNFRNSWINDHNQDNKLFDSRFKQVWTDNTFKIYENTYSQSRLQIFYQEEVIPDKIKRLARLIDIDFDYKNYAITESKLLDNPTLGKFELVVKSDSAQSQDYDLVTTEDGILVVTDTYYPGWKAYIDNQPTSIYPVNHSFRGIKIPKGTHNVRFVYDSDTVNRGLLLTIFGIAILSIYLINPKWEK